MACPLGHVAPPTKAALHRAPLRKYLEKHFTFLAAQKAYILLKHEWENKECQVYEENQQETRERTKQTFSMVLQKAKKIGKKKKQDFEKLKCVQSDERKYYIIKQKHKAMNKE